MSTKWIQPLTKEILIMYTNNEYPAIKNAFYCTNAEP